MSKFALLFVAAFGFSIYAIFMIGPVFGFYMYEINYFLNPNSRWWFSSLPSLSYSFVLVAAMFAGFLITRSKHTENTFGKLPASTWLVLLVLSYLVGYMLAVDKNMHMRFGIEYLKMVVTMYVAYRLVDSEHKLQVALLCYIVGAAYIGFEAMNVGRNAAGRVEAIGMVDSPDSNTTAASMVATIPLLVYFFWQGNWKIKLMACVFGAVIANGLVLINSRGAFLGVVLGVGYFIFYMMFSKYKLPKQRLMLVFIIVAGLAGAIRVTDASFWERMQSIEESSSKDSEGSGGKRINFWLATFDIMEDFPLGVGIFGYQTVSPIYLTEASYFSDVKANEKGEKLRAVHSIWFQGLSEVGWHGMLFFLMVLWTIKKQIGKLKRVVASYGDFKTYYLGVALEGACIAFLVSASFIDMFRSQVLYWLILYSMCFIVIVKNKYPNGLKSPEANLQEN